MEITLEKKDKVNASLKINLVEADYKPSYNSKIKEYGKKVQLKGFRPGHVPNSVVEKMYGKGILVEEINKMISTAINDYLKENQVEILGDPLPEARDMAGINWDTQKEFNFTYNLGLAPEFDLVVNEKTAIASYKITLEEATTKETIENLRRQFGVHVDTETAEKEDIIYAEATDQAGVVYKCIAPEYRIGPKHHAKFMGVKVGQTIKEDIREVLEDDTTIAYVLGIDKKLAPSISGIFTFKIERISHPTLSDLNEDFYAKVFRGTEIKTFEEFEEKVKNNIENSYSIESRNALYNDVFNYFTENTKVEFPSSFLKNWLLVVNQGKVTTEQIESEYSSFELTLKWDLIKNKLARENDIKVDHSEVLEKAKVIVKSQFGMGDTVLDQEMDKLVTNWADNMLKKDNAKDYKRYFEEVYSEKILQLIVSKISVKEKTVTIEQFKSRREKK